jgi:plasmid maintenance system antidote protein VapI
MSLIISGKRDISTKLSVRIGEALGTWPELWINSQTRYNLWKFKQNKQELQYLSLIRDKMLNYDLAVA